MSSFQHTFLTFEMLYLGIIRAQRHLQKLLDSARPAPQSTHFRTLLLRHDLSEFYEGGLEKGGFSKLNLRKVRRRPGGGGGWTNIEGLRRGLKGGLRRGASQGGLEGGLEKELEGGLEKGLQGGLEKGGP